MFGLTNNFVLLGGRVVLHYNLKRDVVFNNVIVVLTYFRVLVPRVVGGALNVQSRIANNIVLVLWNKMPIETKHTNMKHILLPFWLKPFPTIICFIQI